MMCTGTILQFGIPRVAVGERSNFEGNCDFLAERGVEVVLLDDPECIDLMAVSSASGRALERGHRRGRLRRRPPLAQSNRPRILSPPRLARA